MDVSLSRKQQSMNLTHIGAMEKVYRKIGRRYVECGYNNIPDISDGIWLVRSNEGSKGYSSAFWKVGNIERPVDIVTHAALQSIEEDLSRYLLSLGKVDSKEFKEAKEIAGGYLNEPIGYHNVSASQLCSLFLRRIALHLEDGENKSWDTLQHEFRRCVVPSEIDVSTLYKFTRWLKEHGIKFRQGKNIG